MSANQQGTPHTYKKLIGTLLAITLSLGGFSLIAIHFTFNMASVSGPASNGSSSQTTLPSGSQSTPKPNPTWNVVLNSTYHTFIYNNYQAPDGSHFEVVNASFANISSESQVLSGQLFDLQDSSGQHYTEDQASDPGQSFAVDAGKSIVTETAFLVPDSQCRFTLSFISTSSVVSQWTINSSLCS